MKEKLFALTSYEEVKYLSKVLSEWIKFNTKEKDSYINENCLNWDCLYIIEAYKNWDSLNKNYPKEIALKIPFRGLIYNNYAYESTGFYYQYPQPKFFFTRVLRKIISSLKTTFTLFLLVFKKREIFLNKNLANYFNKKVSYLYGEIIFSNLVVFFFKRKKRSDLRSFLLKKKLNYDLDILVNLIPEYLVELLPLYSNISKIIKVKKIRAWVMDIYECPLLLCKCILDKNLEIIGYQHGGYYGFYKDISSICEMKFYTKFIFWGFSEKDISPFKYGAKKFKSIFKEELKINKNEKNTIINIITCRQDANYALRSELIYALANKSRIYKYKCNLFLHPYDSSHTLNYFEDIKNEISLFIGIDKSIFKKSNIYFTSLYSTLLWELIYCRAPIILFYPDECIPSISYNNFLIKTLENNNLLFSISELINLINKEFIKQSLSNNLKFYSDIRHHILRKT